MSWTKKAATREERWAFTRSELGDPGGLKSSDELIAYVEGATPESGVIVYRNGVVSNRYGDGTAGVTPEHRAAAESDETLWRLETQDYADEWRDVVVDENGMFVRFARAPLPSLPISTKSFLSKDAQLEYSGLTLDYLEDLPTINDGQFDDLKIEEPDVRVWLSRMTVADGAPYDNQVTVEKLVNGAWTVFDQYPAVQLAKASRKAVEEASPDSAAGELRKAWEALKSIGKEIQSLSDKYKIHLDDLEAFYKVWDDLKLALEWGLAHTIGPKEASVRTAQDVETAPSVADPEMQGLTENEEERLREIEFDYYAEGPGPEGDEDNESALKVEVGNGNLSISEWSLMPPPDDPAYQKDWEEAPFVRQSAGWELETLFSDQKLRGNYSDDRGWSLKEVLAMDKEAQRKAVVAVAISAIAYSGGSEEFVKMLGD